MDQPALCERPDVSVVLPVYNGAATIEAAVRSVSRQTLPNFELLVIDDASTDQTRQIVSALAARDPRIRLVSEPRRGLVGAPNRGIALARAPFIARMDADDICLPERLALQHDYLSSHPDCVAVGTEIVKVDANDMVREKSRARATRLVEADALAFPPVAMAMAQPTAMIRADALRAIGGYRDHFLFGGEDRDLWWRLSDLGRLHVLPDVLLRYRVHDNSISRRRRRDMLLSRLRADLAAVCRRFGLDDERPLAATLNARDASAIVYAFTAEIGDRYPVETLCLFYLVKERSWCLAGFASRREMVARVAAHVSSSPTAKGRSALVAAMVTNGFKAHRDVERGECAIDATPATCR